MLIVLPMIAPLKVEPPEFVSAAPGALSAPMKVPAPETVTFWLDDAPTLITLTMLFAAILLWLLKDEPETVTSPAM